MRYRMEEWQIDAVIVGDRKRTDLGDLDSLAKSIQDRGLINPITVTPGGHLITGHRRLEACRLLGWTTIEARVAESLDSEAERLKAERDENVERKAMTPEELVRLGKALEALERPRAAERRASAPMNKRSGLVNITPAASGNAVGGTREVVAEALGISPSSYERAKTVVEAAENPTASPEDRAVAQAALVEMNTTGNIHGPYDKVRKTRDARLGSRQKPSIVDAKKQRRAFTAATATLGGVVLGLKQIETIHRDITSEEAAQWVDDLSEARRVLEALIKRLKERTNAQA